MLRPMVDNMNNRLPNFRAGFRIVPITLVQGVFTQNGFVRQPSGALRFQRVLNSEILAKSASSNISERILRLQDRAPAILRIQCMDQNSTQTAPPGFGIISRINSSGDTRSHAVRIRLIRPKVVGNQR
ncbi:MAG: hypothetical protein MZV64_17105 [Ignavibacteriales bacterium]|nr:hypothetical protein [Ignavibacteriales bacterium]